MAAVHDERKAVKGDSAKLASSRRNNMSTNANSVTASSTDKGSETMMEKTPRSILKKGKQKSAESRLDAGGVAIVPGGKKHKIQFREKIYDVKLVASFKQFNNENYTQTSCSCSIF